MQKVLLILASVVLMLITGCQSPANMMCEVEHTDEYVKNWHISTSTDDNNFGVVFDKAQSAAFTQLKTTPASQHEKLFDVVINEAGKASHTEQYEQKIDNFFVITDGSASVSKPFLDRGATDSKGYDYNKSGSFFSSEASKLEVEKELMRRMSQVIPDLQFKTGVRSYGYGNCYFGGGQTYQHLSAEPLPGYKDVTDPNQPKSFNEKRNSFKEVFLTKREIKQGSKENYERLREIFLDCGHGRSRITDAIGIEDCDKEVREDGSEVFSPWKPDCKGNLHFTDAFVDPIMLPIIDTLSMKNQAEKDKTKRIERRIIGSLRSDLEHTTGKIAVLIVGDGDYRRSNLGHHTNKDPAQAIRALIDKYGKDRLCIYSVWTGNKEDKDVCAADNDGQKELEAITGLTLPNCSNEFVDADFSPSVTAEELAKPPLTSNSFKGLTGPQAMEKFVRNIFFKKPVIAATAAAGCDSSKDSDADGINDCVDKCQDTFAGAHVNQFGCWIVDIKFDNDKSDIKPFYIPELDKVALAINKHPGVTIEVQGHTSNTATAAYNMKLSERRAIAVKDYLSQHVDGSIKLIARGYGLTRPIDTNDTEAGRANNRRVQLEVVQ